MPDSIFHENMRQRITSVCVVFLFVFVFLFFVSDDTSCFESVLSL